ncbi:MAG: hypothetical protein HKN27_05185 [Silicimonas sp.]|nr:hypothetical protein [Silicimonas sp.]
MNLVNWIYDSVLVLMAAAIGFFLGLAGLGMAQLIVTGAWASVIVLTVYAIVMYLIVVVFDWALDFRIPNGVKAATAGTKQTNAFERRRKRNGWIGFFFGAAVAIVASMFIPLDQIMGFF